MYNKKTQITPRLISNQTVECTPQKQTAKNVLQKSTEKRPLINTSLSMRKFNHDMKIKKIIESRKNRQTSGQGLIASNLNEYKSRMKEFLDNPIIEPEFQNVPIIIYKYESPIEDYSPYSPRFGGEPRNSFKEQTTPSPQQILRRDRIQRKLQHCKSGNDMTTQHDLSYSNINGTRSFSPILTSNMIYSRTASLENLLRHSPNSTQIISFAKQSAARKIQKVFRAFLFWKRIKEKAQENKERKKLDKLKKILSCKTIVRNVKKWLQLKNARQQRKAIVDKIVKIQRMYRKYKYDEKLQQIKEYLKAFIHGWRVRRCITILENKIQEFVNEDKKEKKQIIREEFHMMFDKVMSEKLYIYKRYQNYVENQKKVRSNNNLIQRAASARQQIKKSYNKNKDIKSILENQTKTPKREQSLNYMTSPRITSQQLNKMHSQGSKSVRITPQKEVQNSSNSKVLESEESTKDIQNSERVKSNINTTKHIKNKRSSIQMNLDHSILQFNNQQETFQNTTNPNIKTKRPKTQNQHWLDLQTHRSQSRQQKQVEDKKVEKVKKLKKLQDDYKKALQEIQYIMDIMSNQQLEQADHSISKSTQLSISQKTKLQIRYNKLHQDIRKYFEKVVNYHITQ